MINLLPPYSPKVWKAIGIGVGLVIVLGAVLFAFDRCGTWRANRSIEKNKQKIANTVNEIANIKAEQANLALQEAEKRGELKKDVETLANNVYGQDEAKKEVNAALANYNKAVNANVNGATAEDIIKALEKLK